MSSGIGIDELKRLKNQSIRAEVESIITLDNYYAAVSGGRGLTPADLLGEINKIKTAINNHKNASETYIAELEGTLSTLVHCRVSVVELK
jgi:hypothetical protein